MGQKNEERVPLASTSVSPNSIPGPKAPRGMGPPPHPQSSSARPLHRNCTDGRELKAWPRQCQTSMPNVGQFVKWRDVWPVIRMRNKPSCFQSRRMHGQWHSCHPDESTNPFQHHTTAYAAGLSVSLPMWCCSRARWASAACSSENVRATCTWNGAGPGFWMSLFSLAITSGLGVPL